MSGGEKASSTCPNCHSSDYWRDGIRKTGKGSIQRYVCRDCGYRFSESSALSIRLGDSSSCQVCAVLTEEAINLAAVEPLKGGLAGATELTNSDLKGTIPEFALWSKKQGFAESTIITRVKLLTILSKRGAELLNSESMKEAIANQTWCNKRKANAVDAYTVFLRMIGSSWNPPRYMIPTRLPFIPLESEIDSLIIGCNSRKVSTFLQILKETAMRSGEADKLKWTDIDFEARLVRITPEKGSKPRILKLSSKSLAMLNGLQRESNWVFGGSLYNIRRTFERQRKRLAVKLGNPRLNQITFHTLRHWKATMLYHQTGDLYYVQRFLGHKSILNTQLYIDLEKAHYHEGNEEFICKVATTVKEAEPLIEAGFEYVCEIDGARMFKKRK